MKRLLLRGSILNPILLVAAPLLISAVLPSLALAQHAHVGVPVHTGVATRAPIPRAPARSITSPPRAFASPRNTGIGPHRLGFRQRPVTIFRPRLFLGAPFFRSRLGFNSYWWPTCGPVWAWGINCYPAPLNGYGFENYVTLPSYEYDQYPAYDYGGEDRDRIWLYRKDGTVYSVTDYWFTHGDLHFTLLPPGRQSPVEQVMPSDQLDLQQTIDVNSARGFRIVQRDEPWQQYLKDHPDQTPPPLSPSQN